MADGKAELSITSPKELADWLEDKPVEWAQVIALRSALRVLPLAIDPAGWKDEVPEARLTLAVFRALAVSSAAAKIPPEDMERRAYFDAAAAAHIAAGDQAAAFSSVSSSASSSARAAAATSDATACTAENFPSGSYAATVYASSSAAAESAEYSFSSAQSRDSTAYASVVYKAISSVAVWRAISEDCMMLSEASSTMRFLRAYLWPDAPDWFMNAWDRGRNLLVSQMADGWMVWAQWYDARIRSDQYAFPKFNHNSDREFSDWLFSLDDEWWDRDVAEVNREIAEKVKDLALAKPPTDAELRQEQSVVNYTIDEDGVTQIASEPLPNGIQDDQDTQDNYGEIGRLIEEALLECDPNRTQDKAMGPATNLLKEGMGANISEMRPRLFILRAKEVVRRFEDREAGNAMTPLSQGQADAFAPLVDALKTLAEFDPKLNELWVGRKDGEAGLTKEQLVLVVMALADVRQMSPDAQQAAETYVAQVDDDAAPDDPALKQANDGIGNAVKAMGKAAKKTDEALKTTDRAIRVAEKGGKMWDKLHDKLPSGDTVSRILEWLNNLPGGGAG